MKLNGGIAWEYLSKKNIVFGTGLNFGEFGMLVDTEDNILNYNQDENMYSLQVPNWAKNVYSSYSNLGAGLDLFVGSNFNLARGQSVELKFVMSFYSVTEHHSHKYTVNPLFSSYIDSTFTINEKTKHYTVSNGFYFKYRIVLTRKMHLKLGVGMKFYFPIKNDYYKPSGVEPPMAGLEYMGNISVLYKLSKG